MNSKNGFKKFNKLDHEEKEEIVRIISEKYNTRQFARDILNLQFSEFKKEKWDTGPMPKFHGSKTVCKENTTYEGWIQKFEGRLPPSIRISCEAISETRTSKEGVKYYKFETDAFGQEHKFEIDEKGNFIKKEY